MTIAITHGFVSSKGDSADPTEIQPSHWNADHDFECAANSVLGNSTASVGPVAEIPMGTLGASILATNTINDLIAAGVALFSTGDVKLTYKSSPDSGWLMMQDQTIGNTSSGATYANANAQALFTLLWENISSPSGNVYAIVAGGLGANPSADWAAQKPMQLTKMLGRALAIAGAGSGLTSRALGQILGEESHTLALAEAPTGQMSLNFNDPGHSHSIDITFTGTGGGVGGFVGNGGSPVSAAALSTTTGITSTLTDHAGGGAHNNMQPSSFLNIMIKL